MNQAPPLTGCLTAAENATFDLHAGDRGFLVFVMAAQLRRSLIEFIHECVPTYQAVELLLFFASHPDGEFSEEEAVMAMRPALITVPAVREYASLFVDKGLICQSHGRYRYGPATEDLQHRIGELADAYNKKPVTLIRAVHRIADGNVQPFADSSG
jgi:hypothetical protein